MGIVNDEEFEKQLHNTVQEQKETRASEMQTNVESTVEELPSKGRKEGDNNIPSSLRNMIGVAGATESRLEALALAKMFDVSASSASAYANSATSTKTYNEPKKSISDIIRNRKNNLTKKALLKLGNGLDKITEDKLDGLDARELAAFSKDMSAIVKNMEPEVQNDSSISNVKFVIFTPELRKESSYDIIEGVVD